MRGGEEEEEEECGREVRELELVGQDEVVGGGLSVVDGGACERAVLQAAVGQAATGERSLPSRDLTQNLAAKIAELSAFQLTDYGEEFITARNLYAYSLTNKVFHVSLTRAFTLESQCNSCSARSPPPALCCHQVQFAGGASLCCGSLTRQSKRRVAFSSSPIEFIR